MFSLAYSTVLTFDYTNHQNKWYSNSSFTSNGNTIGVDYQQWSSYNYDFTLKYTVCKPGSVWDTDYCSNSSSIKNQGNTRYMELGSATAGTGRKIRFDVTSGGGVYISGTGQVYQED